MGELSNRAVHHEDTPGTKDSRPSKSFLSSNPRGDIIAIHWPSAFSILGPLILFWEFVFGGRALFWGTPMLQFQPWREYAFRLLRAGIVPLWNPYLGMGAPLLANYQSAVFYPPNWIFFAVSADLGLGLLAVAHVIFAGLGMVRLARHLGLGELGQALAGLCFALSGYVVARLGFITINNAVAWLPWLVLGADRLFFSRGPRAVLGLALPLGMLLLAGHAQIGWYSMLFSAGWYAWRMITARDAATLARRIWGRATLAIGAACALAFSAAAVQLLPTLELLRLSARGSLDKYEFITTYSFWPWRLATLLAPDLFGNPAHGDYWGYGNYWEDAIYVGVLPLLLALSALAFRFRLLPSGSNFQPSPTDHTTIARHRSLVTFLSLSIVFTLPVAFGKFTPLFHFLYDHIPTFNLFQAPARIMVVIVFALSLLAGIGAEGWRGKAEGRALYWLRLGTAGGFAVTLAAGLGVWLLDVRVTFLRAVAMLGVWLFGAGVLALLKPAGESRPWSVAVAILVLSDLTLAGWALNPSVDLGVFRNAPESVEAARRQSGGGRVLHLEDDEYRLKFEEFFQFDSFRSVDDWAAVRASLLPNTAMNEGLPSANNFEPLLTERYERWMSMLNDAPPGHAARLLRLMNVTLRVSAGRASGDDVVYSAPTFSILRTGDGAARARILTTVRFVPDAESALAAVAAPDFDPERVVVIEADDPGLDSSTLWGRACRAPVFAGTLACRTGGTIALPGPVRDFAERVSLDLTFGWFRKTNGLMPLGLLQRSGVNPMRSGEVHETLDPGVIRIPVSLSQPGYLLLSDAYYPGWQASVDGEPAPILRADYLFRAVRLTAGEHVVEFRYRPLSFTLGAIVSVLGWGAGFAIWALSRREEADTGR